MPMSHVNEANCPSCAVKLTQAHDLLKQWFLTLVVPQFPGTHISWSYRDKDSQEQAFNAGRSKLHYPDSAHNKTDASGAPCSLALDLFELTDAGLAVFPVGLYADIAEASKKDWPNILWGGKWKHLGDFDHFQIELETPPLDNAA